MLLVCVTPPIKAGPADAKIPASLAGIADLLGVLEYSKLALNVAFFVRYEYFPHPKSEAACGCVPQLVVAMRTASRRNSSVYLVAITYLLHSKHCSKEAGTKP